MARGHCIRFALLFVLGLHACAFRAKVPVTGLGEDEGELVVVASDQHDTILDTGAKMLASEAKKAWAKAFQEILPDPLTVVTFDSIARVRFPELIEKNFADAVAKAVTERSAMAIITGAASGVSKETWTTEFVLKLLAFDKSCKSNPPCTGELSFKAFMALPRADSWTFEYKKEYFDPTTKDLFRQLRGSGYPFADMSEIEDTYLDLYLARQGYSWHKASLAKAFIEGNQGAKGVRNEEAALANAANEMGPERKLDKLQEFTFLDTNHNGLISFAEILEYITTDEDLANDQLDFALMARVQAEDFKALKCPDILVKDIMDIAGREAIDKQWFEALTLPDVVREFVRMDKMVPPATAHASLKKGDRVQDAFTGELKFYQFANALPNINGNSNGDVQVQINGEDLAIATLRGVRAAEIANPLVENVRMGKNPLVRIVATLQKTEAVRIHVPSVQEVTGEKNRYEIRSQELDKWLAQEGGMSNGLVLPTNKWKYAKKLAENVVTWADGQGGAVNGVITAAAGADEWSNVAGRLALFMKLDNDNDGKVTFKEAYPYLKTWVANPEPQVGGGCFDLAAANQAVAAAGSRGCQLQECKDALRDLEAQLGTAQQALQSLKLASNGGKDA